MESWSVVLESIHVIEQKNLQYKLTPSTAIAVFQLFSSHYGQQMAN